MIFFNTIILSQNFKNTFSLNTALYYNPTPTPTVPFQILFPGVVIWICCSAHPKNKKNLIHAADVRGHSNTARPQAARNVSLPCAPALTVDFSVPLSRSNKAAGSQSPPSSPPPQPRSPPKQPEPRSRRQQCPAATVNQRPEPGGPSLLGRISRARVCCRGDFCDPRRIRRPQIRLPRASHFLCPRFVRLASPAALLRVLRMPL
jgi:hypothetical protein